MLLPQEVYIAWVVVAQYSMAQRLKEAMALQELHIVQLEKLRQKLRIGLVVVAVQQFFHPGMPAQRRQQMPGPRGSDPLAFSPGHAKLHYRQQEKDAG